MNKVGLIGLLVCFTVLAGCDDSTSQKNPSVTTPSPIAVDSSAPPPPPALAAQEQEPAPAPAPAGDQSAPTIKGLVLGGNIDVVNAFILRELSSDTREELSSADIQAIAQWNSTRSENDGLAPQLTALGCALFGPDLEKQGTYVVVKDPAQPNYSECLFSAHMDQAGHLDSYVIGKAFSAKLFGVGSMSVPEFYQALIDNYNIPTYTQSPRWCFPSR